MRKKTEGSRQGAVARALASNQCVPGSIPGPDVMWVEFVVGCLPCPKRFFSGYSAFPSLQKPAFSNSNSIWIIVKHFIISLWLGWSRKHYLCLTLNLLQRRRRLPFRQTESSEEKRTTKNSEISSGNA